MGKTIYQEQTKKLSHGFPVTESGFGQCPARNALKKLRDAGSWGDARNALTPGYSISRLQREGAGAGARGPSAPRCEEVLRHSKVWLSLADC
jgi:hypothetical protein